jgi:hypothetical protein
MLERPLIYSITVCLVGLTFCIHFSTNKTLFRSYCLFNLRSLHTFFCYSLFSSSYPLDSSINLSSTANNLDFALRSSESKYPRSVSTLGFYHLLASLLPLPAAFTILRLYLYLFHFYVSFASTSPFPHTSSHLPLPIYSLPA